MVAVGSGISLEAQAAASGPSTGDVEDLIANARRVVTILASDPSTSAAALSTGDGKAYYRVPSTLNGFNLVAVAAAVSDPSSSGAITVQVRRVRAGVSADMLSTRITIDATEVDSSTAAAAVIDASNDDVQTADQLHVDVDAAGTDAYGLAVELQLEAP